MSAVLAPERRGALLLRLLVIGLALGVTAIVLVVVALRVPERSPGPRWLRAGALSTIRARGVVYVPDARAFVVSDPPSSPIAVVAHSPQLGERIRFCASSGYFEDPAHGSKFDRFGRYVLGPAPRGLDRLALRVVEGVVWIDTSQITLGPPRGEPTLDPIGPFCDTGG